jgi:hypothetical protein
MKRHEVLAQLDVKETPDGKPVVFAIKFRKKGGELVFMPKAVSCGLNMDMKANRMRGVQPADGSSHPTPVSIDRIVEFNGNKVYL